MTKTLKQQRQVGTTSIGNFGLITSLGEAEFCESQLEKIYDIYNRGKVVGEILSNVDAVGKNNAFRVVIKDEHPPGRGLDNPLLKGCDESFTNLSLTIAYALGRIKTSSINERNTPEFTFGDKDYS